MGEELAELVRLARRIAGSRVANPALLPALELVGAGLPALGQTVKVLAMTNADTIGGGSILVRSPWAWATWTIGEGRDNLGPQGQTQTGRTGPFTSDAVWVSSAAEVSVEVGRYWLPAVDPTVDPVTGVVSSVAVPSAEQLPELVAIYLPGVRPEQLRGAPFSAYWVTGGSAPADMPSVPIGADQVIAYPIGLHRRGRCTSTTAFTWEVVIPSTGAQAAWPRYQPIVAASTSAELFVGAWGAIRIDNAQPGAVNASIYWSW